MPNLALLEARSEESTRRRSYRWTQLKEARAPWEPLWRDISEYLLPRRNTLALDVPGAVHPRRIVDNSGVLGVDRLASTLSGYLVSGFEEFILPRLDEREPSYKEALWLNQVSRLMFLFLTSSSSTFRTQLAEAMVEAVAFGTFVIWIGAKAGKDPQYLAVPLMNCWLDDDPDTGRTNTIARRFHYPAWQAQQKYPETPDIDKIVEKDPNRKIAYVELIEPRASGRQGRPNHQKPFSSVVFMDGGKNVAVDASGYDEFPFAVGRFQRLSGQAYGYGPGIQALPLVKGVNVLVESFILQSEQAADPSLIDLTGGMLAGMDTRPGTLNTPDPSMWRQFNDKPTTRVFELGDLGPILNVIQDIRTQIEMTFYVDWLRPGASPNATATEWADRRDQRLRGMSPAVARMESEGMNPCAERTFTLMQKAGAFPPPPESLADMNISFEYKSPIATTQRQVDIENMVRFMEFTRGAVELEAQGKQSQSAAGQALDLAAIVRRAGRSFGVDESLMTDPRVLAAQQASAAANENVNQVLGQASAAAGAAQQGAQAVASLEGVAS